VSINQLTQLRRAGLRVIPEKTPTGTWLMMVYPALPQPRK
jgi:hypothetical protein